jgi:predicted dithiol-disulfide oxidoreductase (DUF899 family)
MQHEIVSREEWLAARTALLDAEKKLAAARSAVVAQRRTLPWTRVEKEYAFDTPAGRQTLADLFEGRGRLIVYHFMFAPDEHLARRDATFATISRAPLGKIEAYRQSKGWRFNWVSSGPCDFNYDYQVSFPAEAIAHGEVVYGYEPCKIDKTELPGTSVFGRNGAGEVFHAYSAYFNGGDMPLSVNYPDLLG